jgi:hypothetical protein
LPAHIARIAVIADIHGNLRALEAVLTDIAGQGVDAVVCNGDFCTGSAHSLAVVQRLRSLGIPCTRGNHERYLEELADPSDPRWRQANWLPTCFEFGHLGADNRAWLSQLPATMWLCDGKAPVLMAHAAPGNDTARLTAHVQEADWAPVFAGLPGRTTLIGSHLHWYWQRRWQGCRFVRTPSVGLPLDGNPRAGYLLLQRRPEGWQAEERRLVYDLEAELDAFRRSEFYHRGGLIAHLFWEELRTARWWIIPFFAHLRRVQIAAAIRPSEGYDADQLAAAWRTFDRSSSIEYDPDG